MRRRRERLSVGRSLHGRFKETFVDGIDSGGRNDAAKRMAISLMELKNIGPAHPLYEHFVHLRDSNYEDGSTMLKLFATMELRALAAPIFNNYFKP